MADERQIYIRVTGSRGPAWRPVEAERIEGDVYRITGSATPASGESWEFASQDLVRCKPYELTDDDVVMVAFEKVGSES